MKIKHWISEHFLFILTLFLLAFIPLYPKLPLLDIKNTWVYVRIEDFIVAFVWILFFIQLLRKKVSLKTPLSLPILVFWIVGGLATLHGVLFIFPKITEAYPHLALLNYLRRIEYLSLFFLAFVSIKKREFITPVVVVLSATLLLVFFYGLGQRFLGFNAYLTMNEEFAKGIPLRLSPLARISSTFAGHYDLAAYLTLLIPIMGSLVFGYKKLYIKLFFIFTAIAGLILLLMTSSRTSFAVYLVSIVTLLILQKSKKFIIPVIALSILLLFSFEGTSSRFASTFTQVDLAVDSRTGKAIGIVSEGGEKSGKIVIEDKLSTGENLPQGSKYINLPNASGKQFQSEIVYKKLKTGSNEQQIISRSGNVIVKKAFAYDVSFTTRFQGEWPRAIEAFNRNMLLGSGYSSINLATDNNYLRILGETGLLGFVSFALVFLFSFIYIWRTLPAISDMRIKSLVLGVIAGIVGLSLNAVLIDVFEASKVAFVLWLLLGVTLGFVKLYQDKQINYMQEMKRIFTSTPVLLIALLTLVAIVFGMTVSNYFIGDDFTWLRWAADCKQIDKVGECRSFFATITHFFVDSRGFFYRPGTKAYFYTMYPLFELFPAPYHVISLLLHACMVILAFFVTRKILHKTWPAFLAAVFFLMLSSHAEALFWISVTGHLVASVSLLFGLLMYLYWRENKKPIFFILSWIALFTAVYFHELGVVGFILYIAFDILLEQQWKMQMFFKKRHYLLLIVPVGIYYFLRVYSQSVWFQGDYSYNLFKFPLNVVGNTVGYAALTIFGPISMPYYQSIRSMAASHLLISFALFVGAFLALFVLGKRAKTHFAPEQVRIFLLGVVLFLVPLFPFLPLGNIAERYVYLASFGIVFLLVWAANMCIAFRKDKKSRVVVVSLVVVSLVFLFMHYIQLQKINKDWKHAGEIINNALVGINYAYALPGKLSVSPVFYFINIPIRYGDAWVFSDGIENPLWFSFQNTRLKNIVTNDEPQALFEKKANPANVHVFKFEQDGGISELSVPIPTPTIIQNE